MPRRERVITMAELEARGEIARTARDDHGSPGRWTYCPGCQERPDFPGAERLFAVWHPGCSDFEQQRINELNPPGPVTGGGGPGVAVVLGDYRDPRSLGS